MSFIQRLLQPWATKGTELSITQADGWSSVGPTWAKVNVGESTQMRISAAFSAIRLIAETVGTMPLHLHRKTKNGRERATDHPCYDLVRHQPNPNMTAVEWKECMAVSLATLGQSYNYTSRFESTGRVYSIQPVHKDRCRPEIKQDGTVVYHYTTLRGVQIPLTRRDVCPIRGFGSVGELEGMAPHRVHAQSLALSEAVERYGAQFFGSGARPSGILTTELTEGTGNGKTPEQVERIRTTFAQRVRESWAEGLLPILPRGLKYQPVSTPNNDAQFIETRKLQIAETARIYRVPLHMLMEMDKASYANTEQANKHFLDYTLMPYLVRIEQGLNSSLLTPAERRDGLYFEFDTNHLLRGDSIQRSQYYLSMRAAGGISPNEIRERENMDTREGADDLHVPLNMAPIDSLRQIQTKE
jgi:HK97 family phage portal protein